jgi:hypothetical protein
MIACRVRAAYTARVRHERVVETSGVTRSIRRRSRPHRMHSRSLGWRVRVAFLAIGVEGLLTAADVCKTVHTDLDFLVAPVADQAYLPRSVILWWAVLAAHLTPCRGRRPRRCGSTCDEVPCRLPFLAGWCPRFPSRLGSVLITDPLPAASRARRTSRTVAPRPPRGARLPR